MLKVMEFISFFKESHIYFVCKLNILMNSFHTHFNIRQVLEIVVVFMCYNYVRNI